MSAVPRPERYPHWLPAEFYKKVIFFGQSIEQYCSKDFACSREQLYVSVVITGLTWQRGILAGRLRYRSLNFVRRVIQNGVVQIPKFDANPNPNAMPMHVGQ